VNDLSTVVCFVSPETGADAGQTITDVFTVLVVVVVPPAELAAVVIPTLIGYAVSSLARRKLSSVGLSPA
jgi:hypothetical protein